MTTARATAILLGKELRLEFRTRELLSATIVFSLVVEVLFSFAFDPSPADARRIGPGLLWIAFLFAGSLMLNPSFARERNNDTLDALRLAPISSFAILAAKLLANLIFMLLAEVVLVPVFSVLYNVPLAASSAGSRSYCSSGRWAWSPRAQFFSAISAQARMRELLLPLLLLPVLAPLLIASVESTAALFLDEPALDRTWVAFLVGFDIVFVTAAWLLCDDLVAEYRKCS